MNSSPSPATGEPSLPVVSRSLFFLVLFALVVSAARRLLVGWDAPLWLDETFTGAIAIQPSGRILIQDTLKELGGPIYYWLMWLWEKAFGAGNVSLRIPSFVFAIAAPLIILAKGHPDRQTRYLWAALAALWVPGFYAFAEARAYSLLFLLGTIQAILFHRLLTAPDLKRATLWSCISALLVLTHYHGAIITGLQGLAYLAFRWRAAWRTWPAALLFLPVAGWMFFHLPRHFRFMDPSVAWQPLLTPKSITALPSQLLLDGRVGQLLALLIAGTAAIQLYRYARQKAPNPYTSAEMVTVGTGLFAIALVFILGMIRPTFVARYLVPFAPSLLLGLALWARDWGRLYSWLPSLLVALLILVPLPEAVARFTNPRADGRWNYSWQFASADLRRQGATRLIFMFDNPTSALADYDPTNLLDRVGGFFFHREGVAMPVRSVILAGVAGDPDPNAVLLAAADRPGDAIIWAYDEAVRGTLAVRHPPRIPQIDPRWRCRDYGGDKVTIYTCIRPDGAGTRPLR